MMVAKRQGREKSAKIEQRSKEGPRTRVRTSGKIALLAKPSSHRAGPGGRKTTYKKRSQRAVSVFLPRVLGHSSLGVFGSVCPHAWRMDFPAIF